MGPGHHKEATTNEETGCAWNPFKGDPFILPSKTCRSRLTRHHNNKNSLPLRIVIFSIFLTSNSSFRSSYTMDARRKFFHLPLSLRCPPGASLRFLPPTTTTGLQNRKHCFLTNTNAKSIATATTKQGNGRGTGSRHREWVAPRHLSPLLNATKTPTPHHRHRTCSGREKG